MKTIEIKEGFLCDVCQNSRKALFYTTVRGVDEKQYSLVQCENCGMVSVFPCPTAEYLDAFYSKNYKGKVKEGIVESSNIEANRAPIEDGFTKLRYIEKYGNIKTGKLLDVGCGHGFFLYAAKKSGYQPLGIDVDSSAMHYGHSLLGVKILEQNIDMLAQLSADSFDLITFWQVLEHLRRPGSCVRSAHTLLRGGGIIAGSVPNIGGIGAKLQGRKWYLMIPPEHISYFNEVSFKRMLINAGFEPLFVGTIPIYASPYFSFGIRPKIMEYANNVNNHFIRAALLEFHRGLTLTKRYLIYKPLNTLIMLLNIAGNSLFFVARKS